MADSAEEETPQLVRTEKKPLVDGKTPPHSPEQSAVVTKVFDYDNLLIEILLRLGFPTSLVCAAIVCKRWLGHASDPKCLSRFRELHSPRLLGYFVNEWSFLTEVLDAPRFVPMLPQPTELTAVIRRVESYGFGDHKIMGCRGGSVFTKRLEGKVLTLGVHHPLCTEKSMQIFAPLPPANDHNLQMFSAVITKEEGSLLSYLYVLAGKSLVRVYMLQDGVWRTHTLATCLCHLQFSPKALLVNNKINVPTARGDDIGVLDLTASSFSTIQLPQGVKYHFFKSMLSRADDACSVYLFNVEEFQLRVWLHKRNNWLLVDTICLHEMLLGISDHTLENASITNLQIKHVGDNGQFVFLQMGRCIFYLDIKCRTMCKVYEKPANDPCISSIHPFMMIWPPIFPALNDDPPSSLLHARTGERSGGAGDLSPETLPSGGRSFSLPSSPPIRAMPYEADGSFSASPRKTRELHSFSSSSSSVH